MKIDFFALATMSPEQIIAGPSPTVAYIQGIMNSTPGALAAAFGNTDSPLSRYVQGIMDATPEELAAAFGH